MKHSPIGVVLFWCKFGATFFLTIHTMYTIFNDTPRKAARYSTIYTILAYITTIQHKHCNSKR